jgi:predicted DNA-binding ribbon-helix-helix protein
MSRTIELKDEVFARLQQIAERDGVTPEVWIEAKLAETDSPGGKDSRRLNLSGDERRKMHEYAKSLDKRFGEILKEKMRKQGLKISEK